MQSEVIKAIFKNIHRGKKHPEKWEGAEEEKAKQTLSYY